MIQTKDFFSSLKSNGFDFFCGVPDSLLKDLCAYVTDHCESRNHVITANEGGAVALAAGYYLATGSVGVVYLQNSGMGNIINPLLSLVDPEVYNIPILFIVGWRGEPGVSDEPQHIKQGRVMEPLLNAVECRYTIISGETTGYAETLVQIASQMKRDNKPHFLLVKKGTFAEYKLAARGDKLELSLGREKAIQWLLQRIPPEDLLVATTGMIAREVYDNRIKSNQSGARDFLTVGSMGHASQIALGLALNTDKKVFCIDGDGSLLMHMGGLATIGSLKPRQFVHIVLNNGAHDSVGGQPTVAFEMDIPAVALACGYAKSFQVKTLEELEKVWSLAESCAGPVLIEILVLKGNRGDLGRPKSKPIENKLAFKKALNNCD